MARWGHKWGRTKWGRDADPPEDWEPGVEKLAKQGQRFLGKSDAGVLSELAVDRSQMGEDWTVQTSSIVFDDADDARKPAANWAFYCRAVFDAATDDGVIVTTDESEPGELHRIALDAGELKVWLSGTLVAQLALPGGERHWTILWGILAHPQPREGFGLLSEVVARSGEDTLRVRVAHGQAWNDGSEVRVGAALASGEDAFTGSFRAVGISRRGPPPTMAELRVDFEASVPHEDEQLLTVRQPLPLTRDSGVGEVGELVGLAPQWAARLHRDSIRRHFSPLVNERFDGQHVPHLGHVPVADALPWLVDAPGGDGFRMAGFWMFERPVPPAANCAFVRVHIVQYEDLGSNPVTVELRCYSASRRPGQPGALDFRFVEASRTAHDGASPGAIVFESVLPLVRAADGWTVLYLAYRIPDENPAALFRIQHLAICPRFQPIRGSNPQGMEGG